MKSDMAEGVSHGYDAAFEPEVDKKYTCPVCLAVLRDAVQTHCGHRFCDVCITNVIGMRLTARCPVDNTWFYVNSQLFEDVAMRREILSFTVKCSFHPDGCLWKGELRDHEDHIADCIYRSITCTHDCGESVLYLNLSEHLSNCPRRPAFCHHCEELVIFCDMTKHQLLFCQKFPVSCTLCCKTGILREHIPSHVDAKNGDCPNTTVICSFLPVGCHFMGRRGLMSNHYAENLEEHVSLLLASGMKMNQQIDSGKSAFTIVNEEIEHLKMVVLSQKTIIDDQARALRDLQGNRSGRILWKIPVPVNNKGSVWSPSFYTGIPGYKIHMVMKFDAGEPPSPNDSAVLCCYLEQGEDDDDLLFPLQATCKVTLFCHIGLVDYTTHFECMSITEPVAQGEEAGPTAVGKKKIMKLTNILSNHFQKNGHLFMKVQVIK